MCALSTLIYDDVLKGLESAIAFAILANNNINIILRDLSEITRGGGGDGNFEFGFRNEVTHPCNGSETC